MPIYPVSHEWASPLRRDNILMFSYHQRLSTPESFHLADPAKACIWSSLPDVRSHHTDEQEEGEEALVKKPMKLLLEFCKVLFLTLQMLPMNHFFFPKVLTPVQYKHWPWEIQCYPTCHVLCWEGKKNPFLPCFPQDVSILKNATWYLHIFSLYLHCHPGGFILPLVSNVLPW